MIIAFILSTCNQLINIRNISLSLCIMMSYSQQYIILSMFIFILFLNLEMWYYINDVPEYRSRYIRYVCCGYLLPLTIIILMSIVEFTVPKCSPSKPRFGEHRCFLQKLYLNIFGFFFLL